MNNDNENNEQSLGELASDYGWDKEYKEPQSGDCKIELNPRQLLAWYYLTHPDNDKIETILYGGAAGGGKSFLACLALWTWAYNYPATRYFIARKRKNSTYDSSLPTFYNVCRCLGDPVEFWKFNKADGVLTNLRNGSTISFLATEYDPADPLGDRFGSREYTCGLFEECQETSRQIFTVLSTRIGRCQNKKYGLPAKILLTCNPARNWIYSDLYKPWYNKTLDKTKKVVLATMQDNAKNLPKEYIDRMNRIEDRAARERLTLGIWDFEDDPAYLIPARLTTKALETPIEDGPISVGIDVALGGLQSDRTVIQVVKGNSVENPIIIPSRDYDGPPSGYDEWLAERLYTWITSEGIPPESVKIDSNGVGERIVALLKKVYKLNVYAFYGNCPAIPRGRSQLEFKNLRSQGYWEMKERFRLFKLHFPPDYDEQLVEELTGQKYVQDGAKIAMEAKEIVKRRLGRSPDLADSLMLALFEPPTRQQAAMIIAAKRTAAQNTGKRFKHGGLELRI